jgi:tetratricopeptide (TPR) repeat protein
MIPIEHQRFVGPRPFERGEASLFFGREPESAELASLIVAHSNVLLYAQSGAGKTSLINAGLTPLLEGEGFEVLPAARVRLPDDNSTGARTIKNIYVFNVLAGWGANNSAAGRTEELTFASYLETRSRQLDSEGQARPRVILFDQFEELFTFYPERAADRRGFFEQVRDALRVDRLLRVVFAMREEYLGELAPYASLLPEQLRTRVRLERLSAPAALKAVTGPLKDSRLSFAPGVAEKLVNELLQVNLGDRSQLVRGEYVEPVQLQVVCEGLCHRLPPDVTVITEEHLGMFGDVNEALAKFYDESLRETKRATGVHLGALRKWFHKVLITPEGTRDAVRMGHTETGGMPNRAVLKLEELHLVRGEERAGRGRWYELTHDRFIAPIQAVNERSNRIRHWVVRAIGVVSLFLLVVTCSMLILKLQQERQANERLTAAMALTERGRYTDALNELQVAIQLAPRNAEAHIKAAECYSMLGNYNETVAHYRRALEAKPSARCHIYLAKYYIYGSQEFDNAHAEIEKAFAIEPDSPEAHAALGDMETEDIERNGGTDYSTARKHYDTAIQKGPKLPEGYLGLGYVYIKEGNADDAIATFRRATELGPGEGLGRSHTALGQALFWKGDFDQALVQCSVGVALAGTESPTSRRWVEASARGRLGDIYYIKGRYDLAEIEKTRALKIEEEMNYLADAASSCSSLAFIALRQGRMDATAEWLEKALAKNPNNYNALFGAAILSKSRGEPDKARANWESALEACKGTDPLERMTRIVYSVALERPESLQAMREIINKKRPPLAMLISAFDDADFLASFNINPADSKAVRKLLADAIRQGKQFSNLLEPGE